VGYGRAEWRQGARRRRLWAQKAEGGVPEHGTGQRAAREWDQLSSLTAAPPSNAGGSRGVNPCIGAPEAPPLAYHSP